MRTVTVRLGSMSLIFLIACLLALLALLAPAATFAQDPVYTLTITGGDNQSAPIASAFTDPLQVTVTDESGVGVAGVVVTFNLPATGPGLYRVPYATGLMFTTDANGVVSVSVTANSWAGGPYEVTAGIEGASVTFHLTNAPAADPNALASYWMADPLDPGQPAPAAETPPETAVPGWWWRDTTHQNALSQHTADQFTGQVIQVYADPARSLSVWVYSSRVGSNVTLIMTAHNYIVVGCGGGAAEATQARTAFLLGVPGFATKANQGAILTDSRPDSYWGCKKWNPVRIYANSSFEQEVADSQAAGVEKARRTAYADGRSLEWGPQGNVGLGWARAYNPTDPALRPPTWHTPDYWSLVGPVDDVYVALRPLSGDGLAVYLPPAIGDYSDPYRTYGSYSNSPSDPASWGPHSGGAVLIAGDQAGRYLPDSGSVVANHAGTTELWRNDLDRFRIMGAQRLVMEHGLPIIGPEAVYAALTAQRDALQYVHDQTLAGMNAGLTESEIAATVQLLPELAANPYNQELVSTIPGVVHDVYHSHIGWFGGETPELAGTLTTGVRAEVLADLAGGTANLIAAARTAELNARDLAGAEKALYLAYAAYKVAPDDFGAKQVYAQALRKNAYLQKSAQIRNYYLSEALHLGAEQVVTGFAKSGDEDAAIAFAAADFTQHFFGISGAALATVRIASLTDNGTLTLAGAAVAVGQEIPVAELDGLLFTPAADWNGSTSFLWNGKDGGVYCTEDASVAISVFPVNDAPLVSATPLADVTADEDAAGSTVDLAPGFADVDIATNADTLTYTAVSDTPDAVSAAVEGANLVLTFGADWNGQANITVTATDQAGEPVMDDFAVTVNPVNDAPTATAATITVVAGKSQTIDLSYGDVETAQANLDVTFGTLVGTLDTSALPRLTYTAPATAGDDSFTYTVTDRGDPDGCSAAPCAAPQSATATIHVTVLDAPSGSISGVAFDDANANGTLDAGEGGLADAVVELQDASGNPLETFTTGAESLYTFTGLDAGTYLVSAPTAGDRVQTTENPLAVTLAEGQAATGANIGSVVSADLQVAMTYSVNNKQIIFTMVVTNDGPAEAPGATLTDALPDSIAFVSVISTLGTCSGGKTLNCSFGTLAPGGSATVTLKVNRVSTKVAIVNTVTVTSGVFDIDPADNSATVTVQ